jgi:hypothetical protein
MGERQHFRLVRAATSACVRGLGGKVSRFTRHDIRTFAPVRPGIRAEVTALRAPHTRAELPPRCAGFTGTSRRIMHPGPWTPVVIEPHEAESSLRYCRAVGPEHRHPNWPRNELNEAGQPEVALEIS